GRGSSCEARAPANDGGKGVAFATVPLRPGCDSGRDCTFVRYADESAVSSDRRGDRALRRFRLDVRIGRPPALELQRLLDLARRCRLGLVARRVLAVEGLKAGLQLR